MLVLLETSAGYALFRVKDKVLSKVTEPDEVYELFKTGEKAKSVASLQAFAKFKDNKQATDEILKLMEGKVGKGLKKFLNAHVLGEDGDAGVGVKLAVADKILGATIKSKFGIDIVFSAQTNEVIRGIKQHLTELVEQVSEKDFKLLNLSLSHSINRFKLKFSPEKLDTMIIQAVALLDDLDKEVNNMCMRLKEWYGWHFPELSRVVSDNLLYAKAVLLIKFRTNTKHADLTEILPDEVSGEVRMCAETSMGTEMTEEDYTHIETLAVRVCDLLEYRENLSQYLKLRMKAVAPNLTHMVGEVIGARLLAHSGSLLSLSKQPASTIQILGAEKALFRALKTRSNTPKYGIIYHASVVTQAPPKLKGKISRVLAAKLSLCSRVDALTEGVEAAAAAAGVEVPKGAKATAEGPSVAITCKRYVENRLAVLEEQAPRGAKPSKTGFQRYEPRRAGGGGGYDTAGDAQAVGGGGGLVNGVTSEDGLEKKQKKKREEAEEPKKKKKKVKTEP